MLALFFEVKPAEGQWEAYLDAAASLKPLMIESGGCDFIDRYKSHKREGWILSYQLWRDEASMTRWRVNERHHQVQTAGRKTILEDYRLRVAQVVREESPGRPAWEPRRLSIWNDPAHTPPRYVSISESTQDSCEGIQFEFESIYRPGQFAHLIDHADILSALDYSESCRVNPELTLRICETERDYGMYERAQAPTYYPPRTR
jgi:heme-degrading monooxygenase HmoA